MLRFFLSVYTMKQAYVCLFFHFYGRKKAPACPAESLVSPPDIPSGRAAQALLPSHTSVVRQPDKHRARSAQAFQTAKRCNSGIRSNRPPGAGGEFADGSFSKSAASLRGAELLVAGKPGTPEKSASREQDCSNAEIRGKTAKGFYSPGEEILFHLSVRNVSGLSQENPLTLLWTRKGDDGRTLQGKERITSDLPVAIRTRMDKPGFVWIHAVLADENGKPLSPGKKGGITFDGGAGVDVGKLTSGPEPEAFDKFWERQRRRLAAVPMGIPEMTKVSRAGDPMDVYAVRIPCAGARPVTGYVRIPRNAEPKSQKVLIWYHGYGVSPHTPNWKPVPYIEISINAHGFELGKEKTYYQNFEKSIRSGGKRYAFDPEQNRDPEPMWNPSRRLLALQTR